MLREAVGPVRSAAAQARLDRLVASAHQRLGQDATARLIAEGRRLSMHEAVRYALRFARSGGPASAASPIRSPPAKAPTAAWAVTTAVVPASVLTPRELEIAKLIARGLSNRAIAEELVISPATAARHVANILGKLGVNSRAQVAAWTVRQRAAGGSAASPEH